MQRNPSYLTRLVQCDSVKYIAKMHFMLDCHVVSCPKLWIRFKVIALVTRIDGRHSS